MKFVVGLIIVVGLSLGVYQFYQYYGKFQDKPPATASTAPAHVEVNGDQLPGLPPNLQGPLQDAQDHGAAALKVFLKQHGREIQDPRRAWIELDYVVLAGATDLADARLVFGKVKARLTSDSPVYPRLQELQKTYE
jgi:hypothetical protein